LTIERITFDNEKDWLEARTKDITSTDVAALPGLDVSPYLSPWELFQNKASGIVPEYAVSDRMKWGTRLQDAIAKGVAEDLGLTVRRMNVYIRDTERRIGSSFDFEIIGDPRGPGIMEIKNVDSLAYRNNWTDSDGVIEAPPHIELQFQHQLLTADRSWGMIVPLVGGNTVRHTARTRDEEVGNIVLKKVAEFWIAVRDNRPPAPDFTRDAKAIARLYSKSDPGAVIDLSGDVEMIGYAGAYKTAQESKKIEENRLAELKARMLERIGTAEKALMGAMMISAKAVADTPWKLVTPEMVGTVIGGRKGYRDFRVNLKKGEK
jgi:predicted phage-related endonuclease